MPILILAFLSFLYYFGSSLLLYFSLHANAWDLGVFNQVLYNTANGHLFAYSFRPFGNYLGDHFSPILLFISPLTLFKTSIPLLFVQALALALAVFVLYKLSREIIGGSLLPLAVAFAFAFNPFTLQIVNFDFHPDAFFPVLIFAAVYFLFRHSVILSETKSRHPEVYAPKDLNSRDSSGRTPQNDKYLIFSLISILILQLVREDAFLLLIPLAVVFYHYFRQKKLAFWILVLTLIYTTIVLLFVMPKIRGSASSPLSDHYGYLALEPQRVLVKLFGSQELTTLIKFFGSTGFLFLFCPILLFSAAPIFASRLLSMVGMSFNFQGHYSVEPLCTMFLALIFGLRYLICHSGRGSGIQTLDPSSRAGMTINHQKLLALYLVVNTVTSFILFSPLPPSFSADVNRFTINSHTKLFFELKKLIPDSASVSAQTNLVPALAFRREIYEFPDLRKAEYVFFDAAGHISGQTQAFGFFQMKDRLPSLGYTLIKDEDGFQIYKRVRF